jgi:hypothetical protein
MPRKKSDAPSYRYHISGQAVVTFYAKNYYLGPYVSPESKARYYALLNEYHANGMTMPEQRDSQPIANTVRVVCAEYREYIKQRYANAPKEIHRLTSLCSLLEYDPPTFNNAPTACGCIARPSTKPVTVENRKRSRWLPEDTFGSSSTRFGCHWFTQSRISERRIATLVSQLSSDKYAFHVSTSVSSAIRTRPSWDMGSSSQRDTAQRRPE